MAGEPIRLSRNGKVSTRVSKNARAGTWGEGGWWLRIKARRGGSKDPNVARLLAAASGLAGTPATMPEVSASARQARPPTRHHAGSRCCCVCSSLTPPCFALLPMHLLSHARPSHRGRNGKHGINVGRASSVLLLGQNHPKIPWNIPGGMCMTSAVPNSYTIKRESSHSPPLEILANTHYLRKVLSLHLQPNRAKLSSGSVASSYHIHEKIESINPH